MKFKTIVFGENGFVAKSFKSYLLSKNLDEFKFISKNNIDLTKERDLIKIKKYFIKKRKVIFISAIAPAKNVDDFYKNIQMLNNFFNSVNRNKISHFIYISSDAVYTDTKNIIKENSNKSPLNFHGLMHLIREKILINKIDSERLCILRPTLIYGKGDTHRGYGPNLFSKLIKDNKNIKLFGNGSEKRDHVHIDDVVECIYKINNSHIHGIYNVCSGEVISFKDIANIIKLKFRNNNKIISLKRSSKMPHLGYRYLSNKKISKKLNKKFLNFSDGVNYL